MDKQIEEWFAKHFQGLGPKLDSELYNLIHAAKEDLKRILAPTRSTPTITASNSSPESEE